MIRSRSTTAAVVAIAAILAAVLLGKSGYNTIFKGRKDNSAEGVAKIRDVESMRPPAERLFRDPYAGYMYRFASIQRWMGWEAAKAISDYTFKGMLELLTLRTKWIDDEIKKRVVDDVAEAGDGREESSPYEQMIILGAGYDTRGFRLDFLPDEFRVIEIDQPEVQALKRTKLLRIIDDEKNNIISDSNGVVGRKIREKKVDFVPIDFNSDYHLGKALSSTPPSSLSLSSFDEKKKTIVLFEGVTQYIPKSATATALGQLKEVLPTGSVLLISYVPEECIPTDDSDSDGSDPSASSRYRPEMCGSPGLVDFMVNTICPMIGEPWISGWSVAGFDSFLHQLGYKVMSDTTMTELNDRYLRPLGRDLKKNEILSMERYVAAVVV